MENIHIINIQFLVKYIEENDFEWIDNDHSKKVTYFSSWWWTHLYLIENWDKKFLARINFYPQKNEWKVKRAEFEILNEIKELDISPKVYILDEDNELWQDITIVDYIEGEQLNNISNLDVINLSKNLKKLHNFSATYDIEENLPYKCEIFDEFAWGEDKMIENYKYKDIEKVYEKYNSIKKRLGEWFNNLKIFEKCTELCICHADLKYENILRTSSDIMLIDWECAWIDIIETDIWRLFSWCNFTNSQQELFINYYFWKQPSKLIIFRIMSIKTVLDFFKIIDDFCVHKRKLFEAEEMIEELSRFEKEFESIKNDIDANYS